MNDYLNVDYLKSIKGAQDPYYFGLGFIQLKLNEKERIHFWHPKFRAMEPEDLHNHRYNFTSTILSGQMVHETWDWKSNSDKFPEEIGQVFPYKRVIQEYSQNPLLRDDQQVRNYMYLYSENCSSEMVEVSCKPESDEASRLVDFGNTRITGRYTMNAGDQYWFEGSQFHRTDTHGAVTLLSREAIQQEKALVIRPKGSADYCPFSQKISVDECWKLIQETIDVTRG